MIKNAKRKVVKPLNGRGWRKAFLYPVCMALILSGGPTGGAALVEEEPVLSDVSKDRSVFEPYNGERLTLRFKVSRPSSLVVRFLDPFNHPVRTIQAQARSAGPLSVVWNGRDDEGHLVPPEAYTYTIEASPVSSGDGAPATYDLRTTTGGEPLAVQDPMVDPEARRTAYTLPKAARVRVILGRRLWPAGTLVDWAPRSPGRHEEHWEADMDPLEGAQGFPPIMAVAMAFALPDNAVIVDGDYPTEHTLTPSPPGLPYRFPGSGSHQHASHPRERCYNPTLTVTFPEGVERTEAGLAKISTPTVLTFDIAPEQGPGRLAPIPRVSVGIYVDAAKVADLLAGYAPYHWVLDPSEHAAGEHLITCAFSWKSDHFGFVHARVLIEKSP